MKLTIRTTCLASLAAFAAYAPGQASAVDLRAVDEQVFAMMVEARSLRWDVVATPMSDSDRRNIVRHADEVYEELTDLQRSIFRGRSDNHLCGEADDVHEAVCDLREELQSRRFAGYGSQTCRSGGQGVGAAIIARVESLHAATEGLHAMIEGGPAYGSAYPPLTPPSHITPSPSPLPVLPPQTFEPNYGPTVPPQLRAPSRGVVPTTPSNYGRPLSQHYGAPYPRSFDVSLRSAHARPLVGQSVNRPRSTASRESDRRQQRVETGLRTLGFILSQMD